ncbi:xylosidase/alpha-L-arabinofuranosidase 1 [Seminavis robusta]|uniref:Xylosidase/alpha-L-arabinofuranosidase 1 n=1 Tax=Seminavis robusta TaxID=568900 RepID=A0A9N8HRW7_9STRA|nr:xylosidase/alpha-L-arabinofuranosidase 1 [Seminavis robusta]|eukprot:Sro1112_g242560.1 xylosidase/alpha-L-arabinofuranosidase 1 (792) ;mRNA; r:26064-28645
MIFQATLIVTLSLFKLEPALADNPPLPPAPNTCHEYPYNKYPYCDGTLPIPERVDDLLSRMTIDEKINISTSDDHGIPRLGVGKISYSEGLHGVFCGCIPPSDDVSTGCATGFPNPTAMGSSFDRDLWRHVGFTIGQEGRAIHNANQAGTLDAGWVGVFFWSPDINLFRDPRWGRGQETPGEDPTVTSNYAAQYAMGLQGIGKDPVDGSDYKISPYTQIGATCKHFAAYDLENWNHVDRNHFDAKVSDRDMVEYYLPVFKACVQEAKVSSIMCSYNAVNGVPMCANDGFLNGLLRETWGFGGFVVSDCGAIDNIINTHNYTKTPEDTVRAALKGGTDINCGDYYPKHLAEALKAGTVTESDLDLALSRMLKQFFLAGEMDGPDQVIFQTYNNSHVDTPKSRALSLRAAEEGIVLLKNEGSLLPLSQDHQKGKILFVGPHANATSSMLSNYFGTSKIVLTNSPLDAAKRAGMDVTYVAGHSYDPENDSKQWIPEAVKAAKDADVVIAFLGLCADNCPSRIENEGTDRTDLTFPGAQLDLLQAVAAANPNTVLVLLNNGGPIDISWPKENIPTILEAWYPGQYGGDAIAHTLIGKNNPSGKLPMTIYPADFTEKRSFFDMDMRSVDGVTYMWYRNEAVYEFGHGLSYTTFKYEWLDEAEEEKKVLLSDLSLAYYQYATSERKLQALETHSYKVKVTNTGSVAGDAIVLGFITGGDGTAQPLKKLFDFGRLNNLQPGESAKLGLTVPTETLRTFASSDVLKKMEQGLRVPGFNRVLQVEVGDIQNPAKRALHLV